MSLLDKARRFAASSRTALVLVPLAAALSAQAEVIFQFEGGGASGIHGPSGGGGRLVSVNALSTPLSSYNGIQGVKLYGDTVWNASGIALNMYWTGGVFRTEDEQGPFRIPFAWDFSVTQTGTPLPILGYRVMLTLGGGLQSESFQHTVDFVSPRQSFDASGTETAEVTITPSFWSLDIDIYPDFLNSPSVPGGGTITLHVPQNSVDINPTPQDATPEPGSIALLSGGAGLLLILRRKPLALHW